MANANNTNVLFGQIVADPNFVKTRQGVEFSARFMLKVDRNYKGRDGKRGADFIPVHLNGTNRMEFAHMLRKQQSIVVSGEIRTESYEDSKGNTVFSMFVEADNISWAYAKNATEKQSVPNISEKPEEPEETKEVQEESCENDGFDLGILPFQ